MEPLKQKVMEAIASKKVAMRSRLFFAMQSALWALAILLVLSLSLFLLSFVLFMLRGNGLLITPQFGLPGFIPLLFSLPWVIVGIAVLAAALAEVLGAHFSFVYKRPLLYSTLTIACITVIGASAIAHTTLHEQLMRMGREGKLPPLGARFYEGAFAERPDIHIGELISIGDTLVLQTRTGSTTIIRLTPSTKMPSVLVVGETVVVLGPLVEDVVEALGIRPLNKERVVAPKHRLKKPSLPQNRDAVK